MKPERKREKKQACIKRESNPRRVDGNDPGYHYPINAFVVVVVESIQTLMVAHCNRAISHFGFMVLLVLHTTPRIYILQTENAFIPGCVGNAADEDHDEPTSSHLR